MNKKPRRISHQDLETFFANCTKNWKKPSQAVDFWDFQIMDIRKVWDLVVGRSLAIHSFPQKVRKSILWVQTDHSIFTQSLKMLEKGILERLKKESGIVLRKIQTTISSSVQSLITTQTQNQPDYIKRANIMSSPKKMTPERVQFEEFVKKVSQLT